MSCDALSTALSLAWLGVAVGGLLVAWRYQQNVLAAQMTASLTQLLTKAAEVYVTDRRPRHANSPVAVGGRGAPTSG